MSYISDGAYMLIKPESTAGTAVIPTILVPLVSTSLMTNVNHTADRRMKGLSWKSNDLLRGNRVHEGEIVCLADADNLGHFLNMAMVKGTTTGSAPNGYTHPFTVGTGKTYTVEFKVGVYAQRFFGVTIDELKMEYEDGAAKVTMTVKAMGQCGVFTLGTALAGSPTTTVVLDDDYDIDPSRGLVAGDVLKIGSTNCTVVSVSGSTVTISSASPTLAAAGSLYLMPQTPSMPTLQDPFYFGNTLVGYGVDSTAATTAAGSRSTATPVYDFVLTYKRNLFAQNGSNRMDPVQIIPVTPEAQITLKQTFESVAQLQDYMDRIKQALTIIITGKHIKTDYTTSELLTLKFHKVKLLENSNPLKVGELIFNEQNFEVLYDKILKEKPSKSKGNYLKSVVLCSTMGPGVKIEPQKVKWREE